MAAEGRTILFSSHILAEVQDVSSRILVIHRGRLRADGPPEGLVQAHTTRSLVVTAACGVEGLRACVADLPGIGEHGLTSDDAGHATLKATVEAGVDPREAIGQRLLAAGIAVVTLRLDLPSLEEFFYQLTEGCDRQAEHALAEEVLL